MTANLIAPVVRYRRMSTENQQYSLQNRGDDIAEYAYEHTISRS
jgi:hypothetical protein